MSQPKRAGLAALLAFIVPALCAGCTTKTLAFGTATKFGLDISQKADQTVDVTLGYDRGEIASIPVPKDDASESEDSYSVLGFFRVRYGKIFGGEPLRLNQFFATGWAARYAAEDSNLQSFFGSKAGEIAREGDAP